MACCGRLTVRCDSTATSAQSIVKLGPESDLNGPGALARMTKLPADDTASPHSQNVLAATGHVTAEHDRTLPLGPFSC